MIRQTERIAKEELVTQLVDWNKVMMLKQLTMNQINKTNSSSNWTQTKTKVIMWKIRRKKRKSLWMRKRDCEKLGFTQKSIII